MLWDAEVGKGAYLKQLFFLLLGLNDFWSWSEMENHYEVSLWWEIVSIVYFL